MRTTRKFLTALLTVALMIGGTMTSLADWQWLDTDHNYLAECYYYDDDGNLLTNTTTPDGFTVNELGQWTEDGLVMRRIVDLYVNGIQMGNGDNLNTPPTHFEDSNESSDSSEDIFIPDVNGIGYGWYDDEYGRKYGSYTDKTDYYYDGWFWIDRNGDGLAECYHFDKNGYLYTAETEPTTRKLDEYGALINQGRLETCDVADVIYGQREYITKFSDFWDQHRVPGSGKSDSSINGKYCCVYQMSYSLGGLSTTVTTSEIKEKNAVTIKWRNTNSMEYYHPGDDDKYDLYVKEARGDYMYQPDYNWTTFITFRDGYFIRQQLGTTALYQSLQIYVKID